MANFTSAEKKEMIKNVLQEYVACGVIGLACDNCGVHRDIWDNWVKAYPKVKEMYNIIGERFVDSLEMVAINRAKEKSDSLLMFLLRANRRSKYGDQSEVNMTSKISPVTLVFSDKMLNENERAMIEGDTNG